MSSQDSKKAKRRKIKKVAKPGQVSSVALQNELSENSPCNEVEDLKEIEKFMDGNYDCDSPVPLSRGPNPYLGGERCLLCRCERPDPPQAATIKQDTDDKNKNEDSTTLSAIPLWVCPNCRRTVEEVEKKSGLSSLDNTSFLDQDFSTFLPDMNLGPSQQPNDPNSVNGGVCTCEACTERRQIEAEHERETEELQKCWMELRKAVWLIYYRNGEETGGGHSDPQLSLPDEDRITQLVHRLCSRDPHQLFRRLESQAREFVLEKKVTLLRRLSEGHKTLVEARIFVERLLDEYAQLCRAASRLAGLLTELEKVHLKKFRVTWELHNKHLFQSIAYADPLVQKSLPILIEQLRQGAASKETYHEDSYPGLLQRYLKFAEDMSVVTVVWRDCQQLIELYNEEQEALKVKQKMLKEDWEFFKEQRKLLEQQVLKRSANQSATAPQLKCTAGLEAQFTETMRNLLQGTKPTPEECHCPKCNRKRCPCDECTITHMITCGIINPDSVENAPQQPPNFSSGGHDCGVTGSSYIDDVTPPSMSSSSSSSGPASPVLSHAEAVNNHYPNGQLQSVKGDGVEEPDDEDEGDSAEEEASQSDSDASDDDYDDDDIDDDDDDCDEDDEEDGSEEEDEEEEDVEPPVTSECPQPASSSVDCSHPHHTPSAPPDYPPPQAAHIPLPPASLLQGWPDPQLTAISAPDTTGGTESLVNACDCHHCVSQAKAQQEEGQCQCHVCLQQQGKMVPTSLPQPLPAAPRPELHLYPHIHGHSNHMRPILQPQLYDLHNPIHQSKPVAPPAKVPLKLDFDTPEGLQEHMYHAFGEWDNTYNATRMLLGSHKYGGGLGTELLPPPPLPTSGPFISDALSMDGSAFVSPLNPSNMNHSQPTSMMAPTRPFDGLPLALSTAMSQPPVAQTESCQKATMRRSNRNALNKQQVPSSQGQVNRILPPLTPMPPVSRPATMGGNSVAQLPDHKMQGCKNNIMSQSKLSGTAAQHNLNHAAMTSGGHTMARNSDARQAIPRKDDAKLSTGGGGNLNVNPNHSCSHSHSRGSVGGHSHPPGGCSNALPPPPNGSNVSVGTCMDPDCETHHDDNYDSIDDSGSEQSSSTSTSNQKEGKYCDCCYCEFFGHSNPPSVPTSKNYPEMRDRLRLRLKRKNELKQDDGPKPINSVCHAPSSKPPPQHNKDPLENKGLDELVKFINGVEEPKDKQLTAKAAKRARQKQRKAEERAKKIEEERKRKAEIARLEAAKAFSQKQQNLIHCAQKDFINLHKEIRTPHESSNPCQPIPIEQRKKKKPRTKASLMRDDPSKPKSPGQENKTPTSSSETSPVVPSAKTVQSTSTKDAPLASRQPNSAPNNVISEKKIAHSPLPNRQVENPKAKSAEKMKNGQNASPAKPTTPASPKQADKRASATAKKVSSPTPVVTSAPPKFTPSINTSPLSNGTVQFTAQPTKPVTPNNAKKGGKKAPAQQVQQNNLNNLNGSIQSPITKNGLVIQADNYQINGQRWTVTPKDKTKATPVVSKAVTPPVSQPAVKQATSRVVASPVKSRPNSATEQILRSAENALQNQEQNKLQTGKNKKKNKKNRNNEDSNHIDEIFLPRTDSDLEGGEMDDFERELEEFKRFCFDSQPAPPRQKLQVNVNLKDIFAKKKSGLGCS